MGFSALHVYVERSEKEYSKCGVLLFLLDFVLNRLSPYLVLHCRFENLKPDVILRIYDELTAITRGHPPLLGLIPRLAKPHRPLCDLDLSYVGYRWVGLIELDHNSHFL